MFGKILNEKMFCRLTLLATLSFLGNSPALALEQPPLAQFSVRWQNLPLADAVQRLRNVTGTSIFLDRRVDLEQRVSFAATNANVSEVLESLARATRLGHTRIGRLHYLGPQDTANGLLRIAAERRRDGAALETDLKPSLSGWRRLVWPRLTEPRDLFVQLVEEHGWRVSNADVIPHDLWAAGEMPAMPLADQMTVLLAGFDLTYRIAPDQHSIAITPVAWPQNASRSPARRTARNTVPPAGTPSKQVYTLRIENQPVGRMLEQLAQRLNWKLDIDEAAIRAAGLSLDALVSFEVKNADERELLRALLSPVGLAATAVGDRIRVAPK